MPTVETIMAKLNCSYAEAVQVLKDDDAIDHGEKLFELPEELKAGAKKARQADRKPTVYNFTKRERKADNTKRELIDLLVESLTPRVNNLNVVNAERELTFVYNDRKFKIVLSAPRS
jgi:hypothetical protein